MPPQSTLSSKQVNSKIHETHKKLIWKGHSSCFLPKDYFDLRLVFTDTCLTLFKLEISHL